MKTLCIKCQRKFDIKELSENTTKPICGICDGRFIISVRKVKQEYPEYVVSKKQKETINDTQRIIRRMRNDSQQQRNARYY